MKTHENLDQSNRTDFTVRGTHEILILAIVLCGLISIAIDLLQRGGYVNFPIITPVLNRDLIDLPLIIVPSILLCGFGLGLRSIEVMPTTRIQEFVSLTAIVVLSLAIFPDSGLGLNLEFWAGYGAPTLITSLFLGLVFALRRTLMRKPSLKFEGIPKLAAIVFAWIVIVLYLPIFVQPPNGLLNFGDTSYHVVDELLAPYSGRFPYGDYSPQYTGILGWLLYPLKLFSLSGSQLMTIVIVACNAMGILLPLGATQIVKRLYPETPASILIASCITTCFASAEFNGSSTILKEFSFSARLIPVVAALLALVRFLDISRPRKAPGAIGLGVLIALSVLNNGDVGLGFGVIVVAVLSLLVATKKLTPSLFLKVIISLTTSMVSYFTLGFALGKRPTLRSYWGLRSVSPRSLYDTFPFHGFGAHILVMAICVASIAVGINTLRAANATGREISRGTVFLVTGLLTTVMLTRFAVRPIPQGIPGVLLPAFIPGSMLVLDGLQRIRASSLRGSLGLLTAFGIFASLPIAAVWQYPSPRDEVRRISGQYAGTTDWSSTPGRVADGYTVEALFGKNHIDAELRQLTKRLPQSSVVGYFGIYGHTVQLLTGVRNVLGIPAPESLRFGKSQFELACRPLTMAEVGFVIVYGSPFPCTGYVRDDRYSTTNIAVYRRQ